MIDQNNSSLDWQKHTGDILVMAVGSLEQHAGHLPVGMDFHYAEMMADAIAEHFVAAKLPTIPIGNSFEHTGFRGSFSFRPETLMAIVRDLADEAERQNFAIFIIASGHGGNFALAPVVRDLNRQDRKVKLILIDSTGFAETGVCEAPGLDMHAGEFELSIALAEEVEPTGPIPAGKVDQTAVPFQRADLNTFGVGCFHPDGFIGFPELASREKGEALREKMLANMLHYLDDRVARLRADRRYAGSGGLTIREAAASDLDDLVRLVELVDWNQQAEDWQFLLRHAPQTSLGVAHQGRLVATAAALPCGDGGPAWINMVIVDPAFRGKRLAARLLAELFERHGREKSYKLDATPDGAAVYRKLGFKGEAGFVRLIRRGSPLQIPMPETVREMPPEALRSAIELDRRAFHGDRSELLDWLFGRSGQCAFSSIGGGFLLSRPGRKFRQLGPLYAPDESTARDLAEAALHVAGAADLAIDVPDAKPDFIAFLKRHGFVAQRPFLRMSLNCDRPEELENAYAIAGPEFG